MGFLKIDWKQYIIMALFMAVFCFLIVGEVIEWIFYFWFDELSVHTMKIHGFWWGGMVALVVFVGYLFTIYYSKKGDEIN